MSAAALNGRAAAFFAKLPQDFLSKEENRLLAALRGCALAARNLGLPETVTVQQWAIRRVPHDDILFSNIFGTSPVPPLTSADSSTNRGDATQRIANAPWQSLKKQRLAPDADQRKLVQDQEEKQQEKQLQHDSFFDSLPADMLTPGETRLRFAVLDFLEKYAQTNPRTPPSIAEAHSKEIGDLYVMQSCDAFLPHDVGLDEWINHRIAGEVWAQWDEKRQCTVLQLVNEAKTDTIASNVDGTCGQAGKRWGSNRPPRRRCREEPRQHEQNSFFKSLPADTLTAGETRLRFAVLDFIEKYEQANPGKSPSIDEAYSKDIGDLYVTQSCDAFLPHDVGLEEWINHRIGDVVCAEWEEERQCAVLTLASDNA